jgi:hypothetical protein
MPKKKTDLYMRRVVTDYRSKMNLIGGTGL